MNTERIKYLREELEAEQISYAELAEIEAEFARIPDEQLRDLRENATASDMLDEIEGARTPAPSQRCPRCHSRAWRTGKDGRTK